MFGQQTKLSFEHQTLKENHETLVKDYECLEERLKLVDETYELFKLQLENRNKELEVKNASLLEDCVRERNEKGKFKKMFEEMKKRMEDERNEKEKFQKMFEEMKKSMEDKRNAEFDALRKINLELKLVNKKEADELERIEKKYVELAKKFCVLEVECANLCYAEVVASGTLSAVMSGIGETENLIGQGENEVNHNANNGVTGAIVISEESDAEHENPPRESNISSHQFAEIKQEEQFRNIANASNENRASGEIFTPRSTNHGAAFTAPSSSSSSSSDSSEVAVKLPTNWPEWMKGPGNGSNKS
ncbi:hypothetical protein V5N11_002187 [Cardamine amara subsp. amara]|uniref:Uncharacterized protein n=1 Tax=Cardamine amara subsp. amara TaxID=228776 RepID=A0ABD1BKQ7_CARAN